MFPARKARPAATGPRSAPGTSSLLLYGAAVALLLLWAGLASLAAVHYRSRLDGYRVELKDEREDGTALRQELGQARDALEDRANEFAALRSVSGELLNQLARTTDSPADMRVVLDILRRLGAPVFGRNLNEQETGLALQRLRDALGAPGEDVVQSVEWIRGLQLLADKGFLPPARVPEAADAVTRELYLRDNTRAPKPAVAGPRPPSAADSDPVPPAAPAPKPPIRYANAELRFEVQFPPDWTVKDKELPNAVLAQSPRVENGLVDRGYAVVAGVALQRDLMTEEYFRQRVETLKSENPGTAVEREGRLPLEGGEACFALTTHGEGSLAMRSLNVVVVRGDIGYALTFRAKTALFPRLEPTFLGIVKSFRTR